MLNTFSIGYSLIGRGIKCSEFLSDITDSAVSDLVISCSYIKSLLLTRYELKNDHSAKIIGSPFNGLVKDRASPHKMLVSNIYFTIGNIFSQSSSLYSWQ